MKRKLIKRYILLSLPFICGLLLYGIGYYGIVSSLLFFCGGYIFVKNVFDYRVVKKNIKKCIGKNDSLGINISNRDIVDNIMLDLDSEIDRSNIDEVEQNDDNNVDIRIGNEDDCKNKYKYEYIKCDNIPGLKSTIRHKKVRRRY